MPEDLRCGKLIGAKATGHIIPIGEWVVREACRQNRAWIDDSGTCRPV